MIVTVQEQVLTPADDLSRVLVWSMVIGLNWSENIGSPWRYQPKNGGFINRATPKIINFFWAFHCWNMLKPYGFWDVLGIIPRNLHINGVSCLAPAQKYQKPPAVQRPDSEQMEWNGLNRALQVKLNHFNTWSGMIHPQYLSFGDIEFTTARIIIHVDRENEVWTSGWNGALQYVQTFCAHVLGAINATSKRQKMWVFRWQQWSQKDVNFLPISLHYLHSSLTIHLRITFLTAYITFTTVRGLSHTSHAICTIYFENICFPGRKNHHQ